MTIDKMIQHMTDRETEAGCWIDTNVGNAICAALKAGQDLAETVRKWDEGFISGREARKLVSEKRQIWDELTSEDEG